MQHAQITPPKHHPLGTCLVVEDSEHDSARIVRAMSKTHKQMKIEVASTLQRARTALSRGRMDLILLDNNLPDGLGANFALELSRDKQLATIPVIMVSDWPSPFMWEKAASAGVSYVLNKTEFDTSYVSAVLRNGKPRAAGKETGSSDAMGKKNPATGAG